MRNDVYLGALKLTTDESQDLEHETSAATKAIQTTRTYMQAHTDTHIYAHIYTRIHTDTNTDT